MNLTEEEQHELEEKWFVQQNTVMLTLYDANAARITQLAKANETLHNEMECLKGLIECLTQAITDLRNSKNP